MTNTHQALVHQSFRTKVVAKPDAVAGLPEEIALLGCRKPMVLSSESIGRSAVFEGIRRMLDRFEPGHGTAIPQHSSVETVRRMTEVAGAVGADCLVAVGGGSVSDTAKAVALALAEGEPIARHATRQLPSGAFDTAVLLRPKLPIISVPMSASGAEVTPSLGIRSETGAKLLFWDGQLASRVVLIDPVANLTVPASIMLSTGMNGLAHCIEALYSKRRSPISSALAAHGTFLFKEALQGVASFPEQWERRADLLWAAHLSGMVLASAGSCIHHAICHVLGAQFRLRHGDVNAVMLPHAIDFNASAAVAELAPLQGSGENAAQMVRSLQERIGVPRWLRDLGVPRDALRGVAETVMHERGLANNPRAVRDPGEVEAILLSAW